MVIRTAGEMPLLRSRVQPATKQNLEPDAPEPEKSNRRQGAVAQRIITSIVAIPIVLVFVWFGGWWAFAASALLVVLGINELHTMMIHEGYRPLIVISLVLSLLFLLGPMFPQQRLILLEIGLVIALLVSFPLLFFCKRLDGAMV